MGYAIVRPATAFSYDPHDKKQRRIEDPAHLAFIRKLPSVVSGKTPCEACHIRAGNPLYRKKRTGLQQKPDDAWALPLTADEHKHQHSENEKEWWRAQGVSPFEIALRLYEVSGDIERGIAIIKAARAS